MWLRRILMNQADASPGGGATVAPAASQAQGTAAPAPTIDVANLAKDIGAQVRDAMFAELRRAGVLSDGNGKKGKETQGGDGATPPPAQAGDDIERRIQRASDLEGAMGHAQLSNDQKARVRVLFKADSPEDIGGWVSSTVTALGIGKTAAAIQQTTNQGTTTPPQRTASDAGGIAPPGQQNGEQLLHKMSDTDREAWIRQNGIGPYMRKLEEELKGRRIKFR
jgi:hypothetical protein